MKILFVWPATTMSIGDVARGYRSALEKAGHEIADYQLGVRMGYHRKAIPEAAATLDNVTRQASETILNEALYHGSELVLIASGLNVHPISLWLLGRIGIPAAVILTESPYDDEAQYIWASSPEKFDVKVDLAVFTNDRYSAEKYGWGFLAPSFDPSIHHPTEPVEDFACDVMMVGTGWKDRQQFLEAVDWTGIDLRLYGIWPELTNESPLFPYYHPHVVNNRMIAGMYCSAKINLNIHRKHSDALTPGPRVFELAGCGAFQLSDPREDLVRMFEGNVPTFNSPTELGEAIRYFLERPEERSVLAAGALDCACGEDFDKRVAQLEAALESRYSVKVVA